MVKKSLKFIIHAGQSQNLIYISRGSWPLVDRGALVLCTEKPFTVRTDFGHLNAFNQKILSMMSWLHLQATRESEKRIPKPSMVKH